MWFEWAAMAALCSGVRVSGAFRQPCKTDLDCSLNGGCQLPAGLCACQPQWVGPECGALNLVPVSSAPSGKRDANASTGRRISSWGGSVQYGAVGGGNSDHKYHMWAAEMIR